MAPLIRKWFSMILITTLIAALPVIANAALAKGSLGAGNVYLELDGMPMGPLQSFEGGMPFAELVIMPTGTSSEQQKRIGPVKYADISLTFGAGMAKLLYQWMQDSLANKPSAKSGAIIYTDHTFTEIKRLVFVNAMINEIGFPAIAANEGKAPFLFTLKLSPEVTRPEKGKGGKLAQAFGAQKQLNSAYFRLTMPGIDTQWVTKVEPVIVKAKVAAEVYGQQRIPTRNYASWETSGLVIEMPDGRGQGLGDWFYDFAVKGNNGPGKEKSATIELLDPTMKTVLMTINLNNLWILKMEPSKFEMNKDAVRTIRASMYCGSMQFSFTGK